MVNFGEELLDSQYIPWALYYIDYLYLKKVLEEECKLGDDHNNNKSRGRWSTSRQSSGGGSAINSQLFLSVLYVQTEKVTFFALQEQGRIAMALDECRQELLPRGVNNLVGTSINELVLLEEKYVEIGFAILRLIRFVDLNVTGFRKILKKHDKLTRTRRKLSLTYLAFHGHSNISNYGMMAYPYFSSRSIVGGEEVNFILLGNQLLQPLLHGDSFTALAGALQAGIEELQRSWVQYELNHVSATGGEVTKRHVRNQTAPNLQELMVAGDVDDLRVTSHAHHRASGGDLLSMMDGHDEAVVDARRSTTVRLGQILLQIHAARGRLRNTNDFIKLLAVPMMMATSSDDGMLEGDDETEESKLGITTRPSSISNTLNLLSTFLYMSKYGILAVGFLDPSSVWTRMHNP
jgi:SPX domain